MATNTKAETVKESVKEEKESDTRMDTKVPVKSLAPWSTGARRKTSIGDINIPPQGMVYLTREEIIAQAQSGNKLLNGTDGTGSHSTWYVDDAYTRQELGYETSSKPQKFLDIDTVKAIFAETTQAKFEKAVKDNIVTRAEKVFLMTCIKDLKFNDYNKIRFCEQHTGNKLS